MRDLSGIPVMLDVTGRRCLVVGGGRVAARRARALQAAGAEVVVVAPQVDPAVAQIGGEIRQRAFEADDLDGAWLVVVATNNPTVNQAVHAEARTRNLLVNRADDADASDLAFMVSHRDGPLTAAVHTGGASAAAAVRIRDAVAAQLDPDWPVLLRHAKSARRKIQATVADPTKRTALLGRLTDNAAMQALKSGGESALEGFYADMIRDSD
ncbi:MAG: NAD(P)-dependent oxidoreductase [Planctomycetota bacterium]